MVCQRQADIAVLLATYNGERFVKEQIKSLKANDAHFTLHWLDDQSTDSTRKIVRETSRSEGINLKEWHRQERQGVPGAFFQLLECVDADIYLFCDQDDVWQPGKIDAVVDELLPNITSPILCFSDPLLFRDHEPRAFYRLSHVCRINFRSALRESRLFMAGVAPGHSQGFTRALRDIFISHKSIAREYAYMHDEWMYNIAEASGMVRVCPSAPTTLYRWHSHNVSGGFNTWKGSGKGYIALTKSQHQQWRRLLSRSAKGFVLASSTLSPTARLDRLLKIARMVSAIDRRQSVYEIAYLAFVGAFWPNKRLAIGLAATCLFSDAYK
jgi:glycosyltransferase involved in cell wall biosynthesis